MHRVIPSLLSAEMWWWKAGTIDGGLIGQRRIYPNIAPTLFDLWYLPAA